MKKLNIKKYLPAPSDLALITSLVLIATGVSFQWSWPLGCLAIGVIILSLAIIAKLQG